MAISEPVPVQRAARLLLASQLAICAEIEALSEDQAAWHPAPGEWCAKECLGHIVEAESRGFAGRISLLLDEDEPRLVGWDQAEVARRRRDCDRSARELVGEFRGTRKASLELVESLQPGDLSRGGAHPKVGRLTIAELLHEWVHHDRNHLRQVLANVQAYVWPSMGNAQRFSAVD